MPNFSFLKTQKTIILTITAIIVAAVFVAFTVKTPNTGQQETRDKRQETSIEYHAPDAKTSYSTPSGFIGTNETLEKIGQTASLPVALKPIPLQEIKETIGEFAEKSGLNAFEVLTPGTQQRLEIRDQRLAKNEILPLLFPEPYIVYVTTIRDLMRERGVLTQNEFVAFATNNDVLNFLPRVLDFAANEGWITKTQVENYKQNLAPGFDAMKAEYLQFRSSSATMKKIASVCSTPIANKSSWRITEIFEKYFFGWMKEAATLAKIPVAEAFVPLCYKNWNPANMVPGYNVPGIVCCNCGLKYVGKAVIFIPVCDSPIAVGGFPITPLCDIPLGCLNLVCGWMPNAIWDPMTGICGCG